MSVNILDSYVDELKCISGPDALKSFIIKWKYIWSLPDIEGEDQTFAESRLVELDLDFISMYLLLKNKPKELEPECEEHLILANLLAPRPLINAGLLSYKTGRSYDQAMEQLYGLA